MIQATINNSIIENFLFEKFNGNKIEITAYINNFLNTYLPKSENTIAFEEDRKRFHETYARMEDGSEKIYSEEEGNMRIESFLSKL